jgi:hypothetical protein
MILSGDFRQGFRAQAIGKRAGRAFSNPAASKRLAMTRIYRGPRAPFQMVRAPIHDRQPAYRLR